MKVIETTELITFSKPQLDLIRNTVAPSLNAEEFKLYIAIAQRRGLDPILNQIDAIKISGKLTFLVRIDGLRLIAARTGAYAGRDKADFEYQGKAPNVIPTKCHIKIYRMVGGVRCAFTSTANFNEYKRNTPIWKEKPEVMLAKCAEAQALRAAFPGELSGLYSHDEMGQVELPESKSPLEVKKAPSTTLAAAAHTSEGDIKCDGYGAYIPTCGKYKGIVLGTISPEELMDYTTNIYKMLKEKAQEPKGALKEVLCAIEGMLKEDTK